MKKFFWLDESLGYSANHFSYDLLQNRSAIIQKIIQDLPLSEVNLSETTGKKILLEFNGEGHHWDQIQLLVDCISDILKTSRIAYCADNLNKLSNIRKDLLASL